MNCGQSTLPQRTVTAKLRSVAGCAEMLSSKAIANQGTASVHIRRNRTTRLVPFASRATRLGPHCDVGAMRIVSAAVELKQSGIVVSLFPRGRIRLHTRSRECRHKRRRI